MKVELKYDPDADVAYLRLSESAIVESEEVAPGVVLDYDAKGHIVGLEVLHAKRHLAIDTLVGRFAMRAGHEPLAQRTPMARKIRCLFNTILIQLVVDHRRQTLLLLDCFAVQACTCSSLSSGGAVVKVAQNVPTTSCSWPS